MYPNQPNLFHCLVDVLCNGGQLWTQRMAVTVMSVVLLLSAMVSVAPIILWWSERNRWAVFCNARQPILTSEVTSEECGK